MTAVDPSTVTRLLGEVTAGRENAQGPLLDQVYAHLRVIAGNRMACERKDHTLQATALVHEAYARLVQSSQHAELAWRDRGHFFRAAAEAMRRILIEHARKKGADKRGGSCTRLGLEDADLFAAEDNPGEILSLDAALTRLQQEDAAAAEIVRLRFFAGLSNDQVGLVLGVSGRTVKREWEYARAKLYRFIEDAG